MSKISACILALFIYSFGFSQKAVTLKGKVIEESNKSAIQSATVYLSNAKDSTVIDYTISDKNGKFEFKIGREQTAASSNLNSKSLKISVFLILGFLVLLRYSFIPASITLKIPGIGRKGLRIFFMHF